jgi:hypothetical protein
MNSKTRLLNRSAVRDITFAILAEKRPALVGKLTRISGEYYQQMEARLINAIADHISRHPSCGATIK